MINSKQKLAVIGASYLQQPLVEKAKEMGLEVYCFAWEEGAVCKDIADHFYTISIIEKEEILSISDHITMMHIWQRIILQIHRWGHLVQCSESLVQYHTCLVGSLLMWFQQEKLCQFHCF